MKKLLAALFFLSILVGCAEKKASFVNTDITGLDYAKGFSLKDHNGKPVTLETYKGKVVVMFFGFTQCPDVCPTTMSEMAAVWLFSIAQPEMQFSIGKRLPFQSGSMFSLPTRGGVKTYLAPSKSGLS